MQTIEYVTHASLLFRSDGVSLLTDPFYWFDPLLASVMMHFPPRTIRAGDFGRLSYVYSSHLHEDHSHPPTLACLRDQIDTVLIPGEHPQLLERYRQLGFDNIRILNNGETADLGDGLRVTSYWSDIVDTCLVVELGDTTAVHMNDCLPTLELACTIAQRHRIDYAFVLYTFAQDIYPQLLPYDHGRLGELGKEREDAFIAGQLERVKRLSPRVVIPYSMTMTWHQPEQIHLNGLHRRIPPQFATEVETALPGCACQIMQPGDVLDVDRGVLCSARPYSDWGHTLPEFEGNIARYVHDHPAPRFDKGRLADIEPALQQHLERFAASQLRDTPLYRIIRGGIKLRVEGEDRDGTFFIDPLSRKVWRRDVHAAAVEITVPACVLAPLLSGHCDPWSLLFLHKTRFCLNLPGPVTPEEECTLYYGTFLQMLT